MKIESRDQDIRNLLASGYYRIPRFQRPYSWTRENIQDFWNDIIKDKPTDYFIGSMVVFKESNQRYGVVDGQQRLTTITILLAVLRNTLFSEGFEGLAKGIHGLIERKNIDNKSEFILSTETSYPFFQGHILTWEEPEIDTLEPRKEEDNIKNTFDQFNLLIGSAIGSIKTDTTLAEDKLQDAIKQKLIEIRDALLNLKIIFVTLDDEDDAYIIFETLNTRGKDLSLTDLVKNHVMKTLKTSNVDQPKVKWEKLLEKIEGSTCDLSTDTFIHHFWLSKYDYLPVKNIFKELKRKITKTEAKNFLNSLLSDVAIYRSIHEIDYGKWIKEERRITESLKALQLFRVQQQTPCVLSLMRAYKTDKKIKKKHVEDALIAIESFHFLFTAVTSQRSSGGISGMYASLGRRIFNALDTNAAVQVIKELKEKLRERIPSLDEVKALFPEIVYTESLTKQRGLMKYILIGFHRKEVPGITTDYDAMTIEHLIPQSQIGTGEYTEHIIGQAGNLILVSNNLNAQLRDKNFQEKKKIILDAGCKLPPEIASASAWTPSDIKVRTEQMAIEAHNNIWTI